MSSSAIVTPLIFFLVESLGVKRLYTIHTFLEQPF